MKTALITGASRGIGRAVARELAHQGWAVGINYLNRTDKAQELVDRVFLGVSSGARPDCLRQNTGAGHKYGCATLCCRGYPAADLRTVQRGLLDRCAAREL